MGYWYYAFKSARNHFTHEGWLLGFQVFTLLLFGSLLTYFLDDFSSRLSLEIPAIATVFTRWMKLSVILAAGVYGGYQAHHLGEPSSLGRFATFFGPTDRLWAPYFALMCLYLVALGGIWLGEGMASVGEALKNIGLMIAISLITARLLRLGVTNKVLNIGFLAFRLPHSFRTTFWRVVFPLRKSSFLLVCTAACTSPCLALLAQLSPITSWVVGFLLANIVGLILASSFSSAQDLYSLEQKLVSKSHYQASFRQAGLVFGIGIALSNYLFSMIVVDGHADWELRSSFAVLIPPWVSGILFLMIQGSSLAGHAFIQLMVSFFLASATIASPWAIIALIVLHIYSSELIKKIETGWS